SGARLSLVEPLGGPVCDIPSPRASTSPLLRPPHCRRPRVIGPQRKQYPFEGKEIVVRQRARAWVRAVVSAGQLIRRIGGIERRLEMLKQSASVAVVMVGLCLAAVPAQAGLGGQPSVST